MNLWLTDLIICIIKSTVQFNKNSLFTLLAGIRLFLIPYANPFQDIDIKLYIIQFSSINSLVYSISFLLSSKLVKMQNVPISCQSPHLMQLYIDDQLTRDKVMSADISFRIQFMYQRYKCVCVFIIKYFTHILRH